MYVLYYNFYNIPSSSFIQPSSVIHFATVPFKIYFTRIIYLIKSWDYVLCSMLLPSVVIQFETIKFSGFLSDDVNNTLRTCAVENGNGEP